MFRYSKDHSASVVLFPSLECLVRSRALRCWSWRYVRWRGAETIQKLSTIARASLSRDTKVCFTPAAKARGERPDTFQAT
jgi:hypothetical protein